MKGKKEIAVLLVLIVLLVFYITSRETGKTRYELPEGRTISSSDVTRMVIHKGDSEVTVVKENDAWLVGSKKYPADDSKVKKLVDSAAGIDLTALASESGNYAMYELDEQNRIKVKIFNGDKLIRTVKVGKPAPTYKHTFVMVDDNPRVYFAQGNFRKSFDTTVSGLRDKQVMSINDDIREVRLEKDGKEMRLSRKEAPVSTGDGKTAGRDVKGSGVQWETAEGRPVKGSEIRKMINTLENLKCDTFIGDREKEDFSSPIYTATLKGIKSYSISIFDKEGDRYPAISSESGYPFFLAEWKAKNIMKDLQDLVAEEPKSVQ